MVLSALEAAFVSGDVLKSIELLRNWLASALPGEPEALIREANERVRPKLVSLMRDILSRFPSTVLGAPVLLMVRPEGEASVRAAQTIQLPYPAHELSKPTADLHFLGWLPIDTQLPVPIPFRPEQYTTTVPWFAMRSAVALFRSHPGVFDAESIELPNQWWGELFLPTPGCIQLAARLLLPYPDAIEAARVMQATANNTPYAPDDVFLTAAGRAWAQSEGELFQETCRHLYFDDI